MSKFDPNQFKGKKTIYNKVPNAIGISSIWEWASTKYKRRTLGLQYYAIKKIGKKQISKCFERLQDAKDWRASNSFIPSHLRTDLTFQEVSEKFFLNKKGKVTDPTLETYRKVSKNLFYFNSIPVREISSKMIDHWLLGLKNEDFLKTQHPTRLTFREEVALLRSILNYFGEYLSEDFSSPVKKRHLTDSIIDIHRYKEKKESNKRRYLITEEAENFLQELKEKAEEDPRKLVFFCLGAFQLFTGGRFGEICALDWTEIDFGKQTAYINKSIQWNRGKAEKFTIQNFTKNGESRIIYLIPIILDLLRKLKLQNGGKGLVFSVNGFSILSYRAIQDQYNRAFKAVGIKHRSTHILRHSYATNFLEMTGNQLALSKLLGHRSLKQTEHYAKITPKVARDGFDVFQNSVEESSNKILPFEKGMGEAG